MKKKAIGLTDIPASGVPNANRMGYEDDDYYVSQKLFGAPSSGNLESDSDEYNNSARDIINTDRTLNIKFDGDDMDNELDKLAAALSQNGLKEQANKILKLSSDSELKKVAIAPVLSPLVISIAAGYLVGKYTTKFVLDKMFGESAEKRDVPSLVKHFTELKNAATSAYLDSVKTIMASLPGKPGQDVVSYARKNIWNNPTELGEKGIEFIHAQLLAAAGTGQIQNHTKIVSKSGVVAMEVKEAGDNIILANAYEKIIAGLSDQRSNEQTSPSQQSASTRSSATMTWEKYELSIPNGKRIHELWNAYSAKFSKEFSPDFESYKLWWKRYLPQFTDGGSPQEVENVLAAAVTPVTEQKNQSDVVSTEAQTQSPSVQNQQYDCVAEITEIINAILNRNFKFNTPFIPERLGVLRLVKRHNGIDGTAQFFCKHYGQNPAVLKYFSNKNDPTARDSFFRIFAGWAKGQLRAERSAQFGTKRR